MSGVAVLAGLLLVGGLVAAIAGLLPRWTPASRRPGGDRSLASEWARLTRRPAGPRGRRRDLLMLASVLVGLVLALVTHWVLAIVLVPLLAIGLPLLLRVPVPRDVELLEALDRWVRSLAATMTTGRSVTDAIRASRRTAPAPIADQVGVLVARLNNRWDTRDALAAFADELASPDADGIIAALMLAGDRGAVGATATLDALADSIQDQLRSRRIVQTERTKPYVVVKQVTIISLVVIALVYVASDEFFAGFATGLGQLVLLGLVMMYLGSLLLMRLRAREPARGRLLVRESPVVRARR